MRTRYVRKAKTILKRVFLLLFSCITFPFIAHLFILSLPTINAAAQKIAVIAVGMSMPEGNDALINTTTSTTSLSADVQQQLDEIFSSTESEVSSKESSSSATSKTNEKKPKNAGKINRVTFGGGSAPTYINLGNNAYIKNVTKLSYDKVKAAAEKKPEFTISANGKPEVLIMHTHATESYEPYTRDFFDPSYNSRTTDKTKNVIYVGDMIEKELQKNGIGVLHDFTLHDSPSYTGSYERSAETVKKYLKKYPTIKVVLDVHRDAIRPDSKNRTAPVAKINGKNAAQIMIISGCDDGTMDYPNYLKNLRLSSALAKQAQRDYPTLMRPVLFDYRFYNQNLTTGSILLEMGSDSNSLEEAAYAGTLIGKSLSKVLLSLK